MIRPGSPRSYGGRRMPKGTTKMRHDIIRSLVDLKSPASFKCIRGEAKADTRKRNLVHYHIEKLVEEGFMLSEKGDNGEMIYVANPTFYDPLIWDLLESTVKACLKLDPSQDPKSVWKCLLFMVEMMEPSNKT
jgi:hypothetical protein